MMDAALGRWQSYPAYKPSGVEWLGEIPAHWDEKPLFATLKERQRKNIGNLVQNVLSLSYGRIVQRDVSSNYGLLPESFETYQIVEPGNIILRLTDLQNDKKSLRVGLVEEPGIITSAYVCLEVSRDIIVSYAHYLLHNYDLTKVFYTLGAGVRQSMKFADLKRLPVIIPPSFEQRAIAAVLDRETTRLDALIAKRQRLIELLQEQRTALISHVVTKGLDPNVAMKDSGVEWFGQIPAHWNVSRLKYASARIVDCPHATPKYSLSGEYPVIRTADVTPGRMNLADAKRLDLDEYQKRIERLKPIPNDIFYSREGGRYGIAALVPRGVEVCLGQRMMQFRAGSSFDPRFLMWQLNANSTYHQADLDVAGAASPHVNVDTICNFLLTEPPVEEQATIADYIDLAVSKIDALIDKVNDQMILLYEHRTALISAAVTGKIDVRGE